MPIIRFGHTANNVSLENLESLLRVCHGKILIDLQGTDLENIYKKSRHVALLENKDINNLSKEDSAYIFDLLKSRLYQLLSFILSYN